MNTPLYMLTKDEQYDKMFDICAKLYLARNITMDLKEVYNQLGNIDTIFRTVEYDGHIQREIEILNEVGEEIAYNYG